MFFACMEKFQDKWLESTQVAFASPSSPLRFWMLQVPPLSVARVGSDYHHDGSAVEAGDSPAGSEMARCMLKALWGVGIKGHVYSLREQCIMVFIKKGSVVGADIPSPTSIITAHLKSDPSLSQLLAYTDHDQCNLTDAFKVNSWGLMERAEADCAFFSGFLEWALCGIIPGMRSAISEYDYRRTWLVEHVYGPGVIHTSFVENRCVCAGVWCLWLCMCVCVGGGMEGCGVSACSSCFYAQ